MPKKDLTDITIVLDRSGSMRSIASDTIGGFNQFLADQQAAPGEARISLFQFDDQYQTDYEALDIKLAQPLTTETFVPRGMTALLDAIGRTITATGVRLAAMAEEDRPERVIFVIITDGQENASRQYTKHAINDSIAHQRTAYNWEFVFLGANQDAIAVAHDFSIPAGHAMTYAANAAGTSSAFDAVSKNMVSMRSGSKLDMSYTAEDRLKQKDAGVVDSSTLTTSGDWASHLGKTGKTGKKPLPTGKRKV